MRFMVSVCVANLVKVNIAKINDPHAKLTGTRGYLPITICFVVDVGVQIDHFYFKRLIFKLMFWFIL